MTWKVLTPWMLDEAANEIFGEFADVTVVTEYADVAALDAVIDSFDGIIASSTALQLPRKRLEQATNLKIVSSIGVGLDAVDIPAATQNGILVCNNPGRNTRAVAEHTIALLLAAQKSILAADRDLRAGVWERHQYRTSDLDGCVMGVLGCGNIGSLVLEFARGLGMTCIAYDPYRRQDETPEWITFVGSVLELSESADIIGIHAPLTDETRGCVGSAELEALGPDGILVNTGRGPIVDETALIDALSSGTIQSAGLDVFDEEPPSANNPLFDLNNVTVTPHIAGTTTESRQAQARGAAENLRAVYEGRIPDSTVNLDELCVWTVYEGKIPPTTPSSNPF